LEEVSGTSKVVKRGALYFAVFTMYYCDERQGIPLLDERLIAFYSM
jgi:hypothetical protein